MPPPKHMKIGRTGKFPGGKLRPDDGGEVGIAIGVEQGNVALYFGDPVTWLAMPPQMAVEFAEAVIAKAREANKAAGGEPLVVNL